MSTTVNHPLAARKKRILASAFVSGSLLGLPACHIPKVQEPQPAAALPADYKGKTDAENSGQLGIDQFFSDPALTGLIAQALTDNQELRVIEQEIQVASNEILSRRGAYLPFVGLRAGAGAEKPGLFTPEGAVEDQLEYFPGRHFPEPLPNFLFGTNLFWQIDIWRELRNARDAAVQRYLAAVERRNYFVTRMVADIAENYYELMALDNRLEILNQTIDLMEQSLKVAEANKAAARGTELGVQRFVAEVNKNKSEKLIVAQDIIETENRINFLIGRYPQPVERASVNYIDLKLHALNVGVPSQLLRNRPDVRQAEHELIAAGLDIKVARARFFPRVDLFAGVGYQAFSTKYLFMTPQSLVYNAAGELTAPLINRRAIQADYLSANARQLEALYNYQRVVLNAFTEVVNRMSKVENYRQSIEFKKEQMKALSESVDVASKLFQNARAEYIDVLFAQRDLRDGRIVLIDTKKQQLSAIINTYQALGGGYLLSNPISPSAPSPQPESAPPAALPEAQDQNPPQPLDQPRPADGDKK